MIRFLFIILWMCVGSVANAQYKDGHFSGVTSLKKFHDSPIDSALVIRASCLYSANQARDLGLPTILPDWFKYQEDQKRTHYIPMYEAWRFTLEKCPEQYNLYRDGIDFFHNMIMWSNEPKVKQEFYDSLMAVYDLQLKNLDLINANVHKLSLRSSAASIKLKRVDEWHLYSPECPKVDSLRNAQLYEHYLPIIEELLADTAVHGDLRTYDLAQFFFYSTTNYVSEYNAAAAGNAGEAKKTAARRAFEEKQSAAANEYREYVASLGIPQKYNPNDEAIKEKIRLRTEARERYDSIRNAEHVKMDSIILSANADFATLQREIKQKVMDHYNFIKDIVNQQKAHLGADFKADSTMTEEEHDALIEQAIAEVGKPYDELLTTCQSYLAQVGINMSESSLMDLDMQYYEDLPNHKDDIQWLSRLKMTCEATLDFDPDDAFYKEVVKYFDHAYEEYEKKAEVHGEGQKVVARQETTKYWTMAISTARGQRASTRSGIEHLLLAAYYCDMAAREDPGHASTYRKYATSIRNGVKGEAFMAGVRSGQTLTVNGVTFTARF